MAELVELLGISPGRVHRLIEERRLVATRVDGALRVPAAFLRDGEPLPELRGTVLVLGDAGFDDDEIVRWLTSPEGSLGDVPPIEALLAGRKAEVRRVAQALGF
ncbi:Rv2175c family DNA-binding protein [Homoserinibacter sp. YIM 151385]|uniref:Rv2175c family DNA-binding protein n=1 Tax=Homoserinibacter sp. YIM 151385 TaxID=2985506 RepID=UPI0022F0D6F1|nr:Rv2175c family DNA-binding protein [Homoserinibacter sp. YIM 151385]WBU39347.1 Rv2175c family DNA-binding protein [Homoserinibacter sp. YIM 151385]